MGWWQAILKSRTTPLRCSFCSKTADEVSVLVNGPGVSICNDCVHSISGALTADDESKYRIIRQACSFCSMFGEKSKDASKFFNKENVTICQSCVQLCKDLVAKK
jgi:ATP-dependent protease Clp ATPase subunit